MKIILKILVKIYTIGYFCRDSAKNKFLDLFSALTAPEIRACKAIQNKFVPKSEVFERILSWDFFEDFVYYLPELQIISCEATS